MSVIFLRHPAHGGKVAIAEEEALRDEMNGWVRYNADTPVQVTVEAKLTRSESMRLAWARRKGRDDNLSR